MGVGDQFNEGYDQPGCYACHYKEEDNGEISGNIHCPDFPQDEWPNPLENDVRVATECPNWATNGCYTGTAVHNIVCRNENCINPKKKLTKKIFDENFNF